MGIDFVNLYIPPTASIECQAVLEVCI